MRPSFPFRLALAFLAAGLLLAAFAYNWLGNATHEIIGTAMFLLLAGHNIINRRWYRTLAVGLRDVRGAFTKAVHLALLLAVVGLLATSVKISQTVFDFLPLTSTFSARRAHTLVAYVALLVAGLHLGLHWSKIMAVARTRLGITAKNKLRTLGLRGLAVVIAGYGMLSLVKLNVGAKLLMRAQTGFESFEIPAAEVMLGHLAVIALCASIAHYGLKAMAVRGPSVMQRP